MPRMSQEEIDTFLASVQNCKLACLEPDGSPYIVPVSYVYRDGGFYLGGRGRAAWCTYLQRDGRVSLSIEEGDQRVQVKGYAELLNEPVLGMGKIEAIVRERAERQGWMDYYTTLHTHEPMWGFFIRPRKMTSWQGGGWAKRYKHADW